MKKRGFTTLELLVSFSLTMIVFVFLFEMILSLKEVYIYSGLKSKLLTRQSLMEDAIGQDFLTKKITTILKCGENCIDIYYDDDHAILKIDYDKSIIYYKDYSEQLIDGAYFGEVNIGMEVLPDVSINMNNGILKIHIPIYHKLLEEEYGIDLIAQFNSRASAIHTFDFSGNEKDGMLQLKGLEHELIYTGDTFEDPGYMVFPLEEVLDSRRVIITESPVNPDTNSYTITYRYMSEDGTRVLSEKVRTVTIADKETLFDYKDAYESFVAPVNGSYKIELWGAQGASSSSKGAYTSGTISLKQGEQLYFYIGQGNNTTQNGTSFNGGTADNGGYPGGGATDVRLVNGAWNNFDSLKSRIMIAAGSGSGTGNNTADKGYGGTLTGGAGGGTQGGTQTAAGARQLTSYANSGFGLASGGCAGGGGYYGGGGSTCVNGGGGGSSFISGYQGCDAIKEESTSTNIIHTGQPNHYSGFVFENPIMKAGNEEMPTHDGTAIMTGNEGNGYAKITLLSITS